MTSDWDESLTKLHAEIKTGLKHIHGGSLPDIVELRYKLAMWRAYVGARYATFDTEYANAKLQALEGMEKPSVAHAETTADALPINIKRVTAKELLETLNQLANACSSAIATLSKEQNPQN